MYLPWEGEYFLREPALTEQTLHSFSALGCNPSCRIREKAVAKERLSATHGCMFDARLWAVLA